MLCTVILRSNSTVLGLNILKDIVCCIVHLMGLHETDTQSMKQRERLYKIFMVVLM